MGQFFFLRPNIYLNLKPGPVHGTSTTVPKKWSGDTRKPENKRYLLPARGGNRIPRSHTPPLPARAAARPIPATVALRAHPSRLKQQPARGKQQRPSVAGQESSVEWVAVERVLGSGQPPSATELLQSSSACHPTDATDATWVQFLCTSVLQYKLHPYCSLFVSLLVVMLYGAQPTRV
jgi:hypothetical protein